MTKPLKVLHTSDWHLGRTLHEHARDDEYDAFLAWLLTTIEEQHIDVLLIAGDIFDTSNPPYAAQQRYYDFCIRLSRTCCKHAVITSGNHDSTSFIDVPAQLLEHLNIHVIGQPRFGVGKSGLPENEIVTIKDDHGSEMLIVAAVPYLSDGDVQYVAEGETIATKEEKMRRGIASHYNQVAEACERIRNGRDIPVVAMGHLYVMGGKMVEDDGVRMEYVGSLGGVSASMFSPSFDYVALGHLHVPQTVGENEYIRYSGSPLAMGFGEAGQQKNVCLLSFNGRKPEVSLLNIPTIHPLANIKGNKDAIEAQLKTIVQDGAETYVSVTYTGEETIESVIFLVNDILEKLYPLYRPGGKPNILCLNTQIILPKSQKASENPTEIRNESLDDFNETDVFIRLLDSKNVPQEERADLLECFRDVLLQIYQQQ